MKNTGVADVTPKEQLQRAVELAGGPLALARKASANGSKKIDRSHIWNWLNRDKDIPGEYVVQVSKALNFVITPHELRPDIYPNATDGLPADLQAKPAA